jgi:hypothetical protein
MATAGLSSYGGTIALRFFLGIFESAVSPGFVLGAYAPETRAAAS